MNATGTACLADFGLSSIASFSCTQTSARGPHGTFRWMAPELIRPTHVDENLPTHSTKESDVYSFAMVAIEVLQTLWLNLCTDLPAHLRISLAGVHRSHPVPLIPV